MSNSKTRDAYNLGVPWMTKWSKLPKFTTKSSEYCGPCCDNSQVDLHHAEAIVLCCLDFRLRDNQTCYLNSLGYKNKYDEVIGAGASLAYNNRVIGYTDASWNVYINTHFNLSYSLHTINEIIIIDHEKCGAYRATYPDMTDSDEINYHLDNITTACDEIWKLYNPINGTIQTTVPDSEPKVKQTGIPNLRVIGYYVNINASKFTKLYQRGYESYDSSTTYGPEYKTVIVL
jgi:hypothetical protein